MEYDIIIVGGGHAGCEASLAAARLNNKTLLITGNINNIADINNDKKSEFIIAKSKYGSSKLCYMLIESVKNKYKITKKC